MQNNIIINNEDPLPSILKVPPVSILVCPSDIYNVYINL